MSNLSQMIKLATLSIMLVSCGVDNSTDPEITKCEVSLFYESVMPSSVPGFDSVKFSTQINDNCNSYLTMESSTKVSVRLDVSGGTASGTYLSKINVDTKTIQFSDRNEETSIGNVYVFAKTYTNVANSDLYLPWDLQSRAAAVEILIPTNSKSDTYPKSVKLTVEAL